MLSKASIWSNNVVNPPKLFELVSSHLYRSNMITGNNIDFIESLHLKTIVYIGNSPVEDAVLGFIRARGIRFVCAHFSLSRSTPLTIRSGPLQKIGNRSRTIQ